MMDYIEAVEKDSSLDTDLMDPMMSRQSVDLLKEKPTWRNMRVGEARVEKCLDRFFIKEDLAAQIPFFY